MRFQMSEKVNVEDEAPDFTLFDMDRKQTSLSDFRGRNIVLTFYPGAFTSVCKKEMCTLMDTIAVPAAEQVQYCIPPVQVLLAKSF